MITLDGIVEAPGNWQYGHIDDFMMESMKRQIESEDIILLGRNTYEEWSSGLPYSNDQLYGIHINNTTKYVFSKTLKEVGWGSFDNISLINTNFEKKNTDLKNSSGKNIGVGGSPGLVLSLLKSNLLDQLTLMMYPIVAGKEKRLFRDEDTLLKLKLINSVKTSSGIMILTYEPAS